MIAFNPVDCSSELECKVIFTRALRGGFRGIGTHRCQEFGYFFQANGVLGPEMTRPADGGRLAVFGQVMTGQHHEPDGGKGMFEGFGSTPDRFFPAV